MYQVMLHRFYIEDKVLPITCSRQRDRIKTNNHKTISQESQLNLYLTIETEFTYVPPLDPYTGFNLELYFIGHSEPMYSFVRTFYQLFVEILSVKLRTLVSCINIAATFIIATIKALKPKILKVKSIKLHSFKEDMSIDKDTLTLITICCSGGHQELLDCYIEILVTVNGRRILIVVTVMLHLDLKGIL